jgi:hypothetical protein
MDWAKQSEEMMKSWTETQQKMWGSWFDTMQKSGPQNQMVEMWQKTVEMWQKTVEGGLKAQSDWTRTWVESLNGQEGVSDGIVEWAKQAQEMNKQWTDTQQQLWQGWFELVKKVDPASMGNGWEEEGQKLFNSWQASAQKMIDAQKEWLNTWTAPQAKSKKK